MKHLNLFSALLGAALIEALPAAAATTVKALKSTSHGLPGMYRLPQQHHFAGYRQLGGRRLLKSAHCTKPGGAGCNDCHQVDGHPENGSIPPLPNDLVCVTCHTNTVAMSTTGGAFFELYRLLPWTAACETRRHPG